MRLLTLAACGGAIGVIAYRVQVHDLHSPGVRAAMSIAIAGSFLLAGLVAWRRRPGNRLGQLLAVTAFALLLRQLRYSHDPWLFTIFFVLGDVGYALVGHSVLAYPFGRVRGRVERALVAAGYATALVFPLAVLLFYDGKAPLLQFSGPRTSELRIVSSGRTAEVLQKVEIAVFFGLLATLFLAVIARNLLRATPRMRTVLAPLLVAAVAIALRAVFECVFTFVDRPFAYDYVYWWQVAASLALPLALLAGLLRAQLARAGVGELVLELERTPATGLRDALARHLDDPTLTLALALPGGGYADADGQPVELPRDDPRRAVTLVEDDGEPLAALVHDTSLLEEPELVQAAGAAARLSLENARLQAELRVQLRAVEDSRARLVAAGDEERRRIERDLHDGAQQRLVAAALGLRSAQRRLGDQLDPKVGDLLTATVLELQTAVEELRELSRGIHPTILAEAGLAPALDAVAARAPLPVEVDATDERFPADLEAAAYYVACEGIVNVAKHAHASSATVRARRRGDTLVVEITDDGVGGADIGAGTGLRGLADRVEAHGGRLSVESPPGIGTRLLVEIPCAS